MFAVDPRTAATHRRYPSISLLVPVAGSTPWQARLGGLRRQAEQRLRAEFGDAVDGSLLDRLGHAVATATASPRARSIGVYVNSTTATAVSIDVDVRERTVIDDTFATRDLVAADLRAPRYWVLALNLDDPRLLRGHGDQLHPVDFAVDRTVERASSRGDRRGRDRTGVLEARRSRRLRAVDQALGDAIAGDEDPVIVVGVQPTISRFVDRTRHIGRVEAIVRRSPPRELAALAATVAPSVEEVLAERWERALAMLERATGAGDSASGIEPVWRAAHRVPGLLLVEQSYEQPVRVGPGGGVAVTDDPAAPGVVDDAVDEIIEAVLGRGGRVELVPDGLLAAHGRIAFVPTGPRRR